MPGCWGGVEIEHMGFNAGLTAPLVATHPTPGLKECSDIQYLLIHMPGDESIISRREKIRSRTDPKVFNFLIISLRQYGSLGGIKPNWHWGGFDSREYHTSWNRNYYTVYVVSLTWIPYKQKKLWFSWRTGLTSLIHGYKPSQNVYNPTLCNNYAYV
jgi:hypothetical protein